MGGAGDSLLKLRQPRPPHPLQRTSPLPLASGVVLGRGGESGSDAAPDLLAEVVDGANLIGYRGRDLALTCLPPRGSIRLPIREAKKLWGPSTLIPGRIDVADNFNYVY